MTVLALVLCAFIAWTVQREGDQPEFDPALPIVPARPVLVPETPPARLPSDTVVKARPIGEQAKRAADTAAIALRSLIDPAKLDTLKGDRATNTRLRKACYWLHVATMRGTDPGNFIDSLGLPPTARFELARDSLLRNLTILDRLGCLTQENIEGLRRGEAPTIMRGPYAGEKAEVDHIVPVAVAPEFANWIGNLEFMPRTLNRRKSGSMGERQWSHLRKLRAARGSSRESNVGRQEARQLVTP